MALHPVGEATLAHVVEAVAAVVRFAPPSGSRPGSQTQLVLEQGAQRAAERGEPAASCSEVVFVPAAGQVVRDPDVDRANVLVLQG